MGENHVNTLLSSATIIGIVHLFQRGRKLRVGREGRSVVRGPYSSQMLVKDVV